MAGENTHEVTALLAEWSGGNRSALDRLTPLVYDELRRIARRRMRRERAGHTLQTTALVNEAYLCLVEEQNVHWRNRAHFFALSARIMRNILIDHARRRGYQKHGGGALRVTLDESAAMSEGRAADLVALDEALKELAARDELKGRIVELRYFGGMTVEEVAEVLGIAPVTVKRHWKAAKARLFHALKQNKGDGD
ncbi:MAG TPA: ECF-type sigma factor [Pyrinomonadaceae bacterium]|nr:ECF-type sigma factor [Pyrinomonadaceae bacterium]